MKENENNKKLTRKLRIQGKSWREINKELNIPVSTIRSWCKNIKLTNKQKASLKKRAQLALFRGSKKATQNKRLIREKTEKELVNKGFSEVGKLTERELFIAGITLYWAEGFKNKEESRLGFCNSDPKMILFYLNWLRKCLNIALDRISARVTLNESYKNKTREIQDYWSSLTGIPINNFTKAFYHHVTWQKKFLDKSSYHGVLRIHITKSLNHLRKMRGWIEGLKHSFLAG